MVEEVLSELGPEFAAMYTRSGRQSVPPEHLLKATVLMALDSIRRHRLVACPAASAPAGFLNR